MIAIQDEHGWQLAQGAVGDMVMRETCGDDYGLGAIEAATRTADKTRECLARLVALLVQRGSINFNDVPEILGFGTNCTIVEVR